MNTISRQASQIYCWGVLLLGAFNLSTTQVRAVEPEVLAKKILCHTCLAKIYVAQKKLSDAVPEYQFLLANQPNNAALHYEFGAILMQLGKANLSVPQFKAAAKLAPSVPEYQVGIGNCYMYAKNYDAAVDAYTKACNLGGKYQAQLQQALQYQAQEKALKQYEQKTKQEQRVQEDD
jgi:tetratricopeptide (TPR) repeat protein